MGTNHLKLLFLATMMTGATIAVSLEMFSSGADTFHRDALHIELQYVASVARAYYIKPRVLGGGGRSFVGFQLPQSARNSEHGSYKMIKVEPALINFLVTGEATGQDGKTPMVMEVTITLDGLKTERHN